MNEAYYNRVMSDKIVDLLKDGGKFHWLIDYVINHKDSEGNKDLDFQTGSTPRKSNNVITGETDRSWLSIYKGTGRIITLEENGIPYEIIQDGVRLDKNGKEKTKYKRNPLPDLSEEVLNKIINKWDDDKNKGRYYIGQKGGKKEEKEGYYQTLISRHYTIDWKPEKELNGLVLFDKEFKIGYASEGIRDSEFMPKIKEWVCNMRIQIKEEFDKKTYATCKALDDSEKISTECDFVGINNKGDIVLLELKRHGDGNKIYLSPLQVGTYYKLLTQYIKKENLPVLQAVIFKMVEQKKELGIINKDYSVPDSLSGQIKLAVVVGGEAGKQAMERYKIVRKVVEGDIEDKKITYYTCDENDGTLKEKIIED